MLHFKTVQMQNEYKSYENDRSRESTKSCVFTFFKHAVKKLYILEDFLKGLK